MVALKRSQVAPGMQTDRGLMTKGSRKVRGFAAEGVRQYERTGVEKPRCVKDDRLVLARRKVAVGVLYFWPQKGWEQLDQHVSVGCEHSSFGRATV